MKAGDAIVSYQIICPYCFREMEDDEVLFRSEKVNTGESGIIPDEYDDPEDFQNRYQGDDKEEILRRYHDWEFFEAGPDAEYEAFWKRFNGTTEYDPIDAHLGVDAYLRRVIDPRNPEHQRYLRVQGTRQDGQPDYFIYDGQGMAIQIELAAGERCNRRVCRYCHNPLPTNYGKTPVKFITVVGIVGSGKTVYLSQLLRGMSGYARKCGLAAMVTGPSVLNFRRENAVEAGEPLPGSTPEQRLQQPLFYELVRSLGNQRKSTETMVMYDVAGEVFKSPQLVMQYAPFVEHADGVLMLIDPLQFDVVSSFLSDDQERDDPAQILSVIHHIVSHGDPDFKCDIPFAICISKVDKIMDILNDNLRDLLVRDVEGVKGANGFDLPEFNARAYNPVLKELNAFIQTHNMDLANQMEANYVQYSYFAFTALGCGVEDGINENGEKYQYPVGPVIPKRIEEPLLWMFYALGYIKSNEHIGAVYCPKCGGKTYELPKSERTLVIKKGLFGIGRREEPVNRGCLNPECGYRWYFTGEDDGPDAAVEREQLRRRRQNPPDNGIPPA